jgi:hypothetical protein
MITENVSDKPICFVISPMGKEDSEARRQSDLLLRYVINPAVEACGYRVVSPAKMVGSELIMSQIIRHLVSAPLVIADLTGGNANVFYELALRHAVQKPFIQIIAKTSNLTFDVKNIRTIKFDISSVDSQDKAKNDLIEYIKEAERTRRPETPMSVAGLNAWVPLTNKERIPQNEQTASSAKDRKRILVDFLDKLAAADETPLEIKKLIIDLKGSPRVYLLKTTADDLDAASLLVKNVLARGKISATSSLQFHDDEGQQKDQDADERETYRRDLSEALQREVTYRKVICSTPNFAAARYETWMDEIREKAELIRGGNIDPAAFQLLHYPYPISVDVVIAQDNTGECREMVAGFAGGAGHGGFKTDDSRMVREWLDVYFEAKILPVAMRHTEAVLSGEQDCACLELVTLLRDASGETNKSVEDTDAQAHPELAQVPPPNSDPQGTPL